MIPHHHHRILIWAQVIFTAVAVLRNNPESHEDRSSGTDDHIENLTIGTTTRRPSIPTFGEQLYGELPEEEKRQTHECIICLQNLKNSDTIPLGLACGHDGVFHSSCLNQWLDSGKHSCPKCRMTIREEEEQEEDGDNSLQSSQVELDFVYMLWVLDGGPPGLRRDFLIGLLSSDPSLSQHFQDLEDREFENVEDMVDYLMMSNRDSLIRSFNLA